MRKKRWERKRRRMGNVNRTVTIDTTMGSLRSYVCHTSTGSKLCWAERLEMTESQFLSPWRSKILQLTGKCPCPLLRVSKYLPVSVSCYYTLHPPSISNWNLWNNHAPSLPLRRSHPETEIRWAIYMEEQSSGNVKSSVREASSSQPGTA